MSVNRYLRFLKREIDTGKDQEAQRRKNQIEEYKDKLEMFQKHTPEIESQIEHYKYKKEEYAQKIRDNQDVKKAQENKERLEREYQYLTKQIITSEERLLSDFNSNASKFFALPLIKKGLEVISSAKEEGAGIPNMHASSIDYILKRGKCICGCDLTKNQGAIEAIQNEQRLLPPQHIGTSVRVFVNDMKNATNTSSLYVDNIKQDYHTWLDSQRQVEYVARDLKETSENIKGYSDVRKIEEAYQEADRQYKRYCENLQGNRDSIITYKARIDENEREIAKLFATNDKNKKIMKYCNYAEALYDWFKDIYTKQEVSVKEELLESINYNFSKMYHGSRTITMDSNYRITPVLTGTTTDLAKSEGLETVTNFSFIMGLVDLARKRANGADNSNVNNQKLTEPYPIVMDAPFSNTDTTHIENITARLPEVAEQVIIFVMDKDWDIAKRKLDMNLGSKYVIEKVDNKDDHSILRREI